MLQIAGGILIAAFVIGITAFGLMIALNKDRRILGDTGVGWLLVGIGAVAAFATFYFGAK